MKFTACNSDYRTFLSGHVSRRIFARMLWAVFPGRSENDVAERAAMALGLSKRQVQNLLRCEHDAKLRQIFAVIAILGFEQAMSFIQKEETP